MKITVRPVYECGRYTSRSYVWGIYAGDVLTAITVRYPSWINKGIAS